VREFARLPRPEIIGKTAFFLSRAGSLPMRPKPIYAWPRSERNMERAERADLAHFFGRGFVIPDIRFTREQNKHSPQRDRLTCWLFMPVMQPMRADPRFDALVTDLGLKGPWYPAGVRPDQQRG
jgi:hypothetical protein